LSEQSIRGVHNPGAGGWPTIRYFNEETGYDGAPYKKKTSKSMCDELGDVTYMDGYVQEAAGAVSCNVGTLEGCSEKESDFIATWKAKSADEQQSQLKRLRELRGGKVAQNLLEWINKRIAILKQLLTVSSTENQEL